MNLDTEEYENIFLLVLDTVSAEDTSINNESLDNTPFLEKKANENLLFSKAYSNSPWTLPSHASIFSGLNVKEHGSTTFNKQFDEESFTQDLEKKGFNTIGISANSLISEDTGFDKSFDRLLTNNLSSKAENWQELEKEMEKTKEYSGVKRYIRMALSSAKNGRPQSMIQAAKFYLKYKRKVSGGAAESILELVRQNYIEEEEQFFFLNFCEAHAPYYAPEDMIDEEEYDSENPLEMAEKEFESEGFKWTREFEHISEKDMRKLYRDSIKYLDTVVERLHSQYKEDSLFIVISDHGEMIRHEDVWGHQGAIWDRLTKVPMTIFGEGVQKKKIDEPFALKDIAHIFREGEIIHDTVKMRYEGLNGITNKDKYEDLADFDIQLLNNKSKGIILQDTLYIENSELEDEELTIN